MEDKKKAAANQHRSDHLVGRIRIGRIAKPKETDWKQNRSQDHWRQASFGWHLASLLLKQRHIAFSRIQDVDATGQDDADSVCVLKPEDNQIFVDETAAGALSNAQNC